MTNQNSVYIPVHMFVRITRKEGEANERAMLIARRDDGKGEFCFLYTDLNEDDYNLIVCNFDPNESINDNTKLDTK